MSDLDVSRDLSGIETWEQAEEEMEQIFDANKHLGDGFSLVEDKKLLVGIPFLIVNWRFHAGEFGPMVIVKAITKQNDKLIFVDGSTGILQQLTDFTEKQGVHEGIVARKGLRVSDYEYEGPDGETKPAKTYYIDEG